MQSADAQNQCWWENWMQGPQICTALGSGQGCAGATHKYLPSYLYKVDQTTP